MSKASRRLRREAAGARKSRVTEISILALGASLLAPYAIAQDQDAAAASKEKGDQTTTKSDDDLTEILVTGIRKAFATSQEIKKEADTVVDSITASDIGAFPDKSVAEALQRMSGITVTRFAASGDTTHFSAEPSGVVIRGLPQVRSEFNGRDSFNANSSRGLSFADVSPELMAGVDTYKNATADMIEGGIAGTVNLRTHVPFDSEGFVAAFSAEVGYGDLAEETKPSGSALLSNRWDTGIGEVGLMVNAAYSSVTTESQGLQLNRFFNVTTGGNTNWIPGGVDIRDNTYDRTRTGGSVALQWKNPAENLTATLQYNRSEYKNEWEEYSLNAGIGNSQTAQDLVLTNPFAFPAAGSGGFEFDSNGVFSSGVINDSVNSWAGPVNDQMIHPNGNGTGATTGSQNWFCYTWSGAASCPSTRGIGLGADTRFSTSTNLTEDTSLNLRWDVNERLGLNFDIQKVDASVVNFDNSMNSKSATDLYLELHGSGKPSFEFRRPTGFGMTEGGFADPRNYYHEWTMEHTENSSGEELAYRLDADIKLGDGDGWIDALRVGVRRAERDQDINWSTYNWGSVQPLWGVQPTEAFFLGQGRWTGTFAPHDLGSDMLGGGVFGGGVFIHPDFNLVKNYQATIDQFAGHSNTWIPLGARDNCVGRVGLYCAIERQSVSEDVDAAYIMLKFGGDDTKWGNVSVKGNIGVRFVKTDVSAAGGVAFPVWELPPPPTTPPGAPPAVNILALTPQEDRDFMNGATFGQTGGASHDNVLPSLNVRFGFTDEQFLRFAVSRALARPDMGLYKNYLGVSLVQPSCTNGTVTYSVPGDCTSTPLAYTPRYTADAGNPALPSTTADQIDLTYEWYFSNTGSLTTALFYKKFNDYIQNGSYQREFTNNNITRTVTVTGPITGDGAKLKGIELNYQQFFDALPAPWNGLGVQANFTYVDNQGITNANLSTVAGNGSTGADPLITFTDLPLEGFSDKAYNVVLMFEQSKYSARLAWNWRSDYLISQSDCCIKLPIWQEAYGQLDGSFHFKPSDSWDIFLDAQNILQAETVLKQQVTNDGLLLPRSWFINDRRLNLGVRYRIQ